MEFKDYYSTLGVNKSASQDEIKKAYRKLALKYHPDRTKGDKESEQRFKEVNEANDVLSDPEKRKKYDQLGENWRSYQQAGGSPGGFDWSQYTNMGGGGGQTYYEFQGDIGDLFGDSGYSDFFEMLFGQGGFGGGTGRKSGKRSTVLRGQDYEAEIQITLEEAYRGSTRVFDHQGQSIKLKIKPGVPDEHVLKLPGKGSPGSGGAGDLLLRVRVLKDPVFERKGDDLYSDADVDLYTAVLGGKTPFKTFKGNVKIDVPKGTQNGKVMRLQKMGMPRYGKENSFGDLYLKINILVPQNLSAKETELFKELQKLRV